MQLHDLQRLFQRRVLDGGTGIEAELSGSMADDFSDRLETYTEGYRSRLLEALGTTFPALRSALGDAEFESTLRQFIEVTPSRHYSIRYYGQGLAEFVLTARTGADTPVLHDLARWEWLLADVFDAPDDEPIGAERLTGISAADWPTVAFALRTCVRSITTHTNAVQWWRWAKDDGPKPAAFEPAPAASWRLWRQDVRTMFRSMDAAESAALSVAEARGSFADICDSIGRVVGPADAPLRAASILKGWFADQMIVDIYLSPGGLNSPGLEHT